MKHRNFIHTIAALPVMATVNKRFNPIQNHGSGNNGYNNRLRLSLNAYSINWYEPRSKRWTQKTVQAPRN
jgi:hypothetical protein